MAVLLMRKHLYNFSDERVVAYWETNPYFYFQYQDRQQVPVILGDTYYVRDRGSIHLNFSLLPPYGYYRKLNWVLQAIIYVPLLVVSSFLILFHVEH